MHELAITQSILNIAVKEAEKHGSKRVLNIKIKVGEMSGVIPNLIQEYYNIVSKETIAEGAELLIERVPIRARCLDCNNIIEMSIMKFGCSLCNSLNVKVISGKEFYVESLEVE